MVPALARFVRCSMGFTTSYWQKERWSHRAADTLTSCARCWNPRLGDCDLDEGRRTIEIPPLRQYCSRLNLSQNVQHRSGFELNGSHPGLAELHVTHSKE